MIVAKCLDDSELGGCVAASKQTETIRHWEKTLSSIPHANPPSGDATVDPSTEPGLSGETQIADVPALLLEKRPESSEVPHDAPYIAFEEVCKSFGDLNVLDNVSFFVRPGETLCILGRSGVGKSVSLQEIMGFLKPDSGHIFVAGEDITNYDERQMQLVRKKVTMVFQNGALFDSLSVGENVAFPIRERRELAEDQILQVVNGLLDMVGVSGMADLLPSDLSTGMKRSVAIARALAAQPEAILYDEPTTMVDPLMARLLGNLIQKLKHQLRLTSVVVTHDMRFAERLADRILFLNQAKAWFGTLDEFHECQDPVMRQFLELDGLEVPEA